LRGVAARLAPLYCLYQPLRFKALERRLDFLRLEDLDTKMIDTLSSLGIFKQYQFEWGAINGEIGVPRALFVWLHPEQLGIVSDRFLKIAHVQGQL
jgi:hypothetical protein